MTQKLIFGSLRVKVVQTLKYIPSNVSLKGVMTIQTKDLTF